MAAEPLQLRVPVACAVGTVCTVQNYFDHAPGAAAADHRCGKLSYDGHNGIDFRLPDYRAMRRGVGVVAAAPGTVLRVRDGMNDVSIREIGAAAVKDRMAGNFVLLDHGNGWVTQYGHMRRGSVRVKPGDRVVAGQPLGLIGLSGHTEFPHLHFEVRLNDTPVDPFTGTGTQAACNVPARPLWTAATLARLIYQPSGVLTAGFATEKPDAESARQGTYAAPALPSDSPALVFWTDVFGLLPGDVQTLRLYDPNGALVGEKTERVKTVLAWSFRAVGGLRQGAAWAPGRYRGEFELVRKARNGNTVVLSDTREIDVGAGVLQAQRGPD